MQVKGNTQKWFDGKMLGKLNLRKKIERNIEKFTKSRLHIDKELIKNQNMIP